MSRQTYFIDVLLPIAVPNYYTYRLPQHLNEQIKVGQRVIVQFGKYKLYTALVRRIHELPPKAYSAKYIEEIVDQNPVLHEWQFEFWEWISFYYICYPGEVMQAAIPSGLKLHSESKIAFGNEIDWETFDYSILTEEEQKITDVLHEKTMLTFKDVSDLLGRKNVQGPLKSLMEKKIISTYEEIRDKYVPKKINFLKLNPEFLIDEMKLQELITQLEKKAFKQLEIILDFLNQQKGFHNLKAKPENLHWLQKSIFTKKYSDAAVNALLKKNIFLSADFEVSRIQQEHLPVHTFELSEIQNNAYEKLKLFFKTYSVSLLHGITGSGKTEIYSRLIKDEFDKGNNVLYLVPEIALTTQLIQRMQFYFGDKVLVYHSKFSENERVEVWNKVLSNPETPFMVIGARSSIFLPFQKLGLLIVDEEHDASFKQHDPSPRYNARDLAVYLAGIHHSKVIMGSATPSFETFQNCIENKFAKVDLNVRFGLAELPYTFIANVKNDETRKFTSIGIALKEAIQESLEQQSQVILFQNRRGFAPYTQCETCAWIPTCTNCDVSLIYHKARQQYNCHYCGYTSFPIASCKACGSNNLRFKGSGTEKIEEEIELLFPSARVQRMDLDSTRNKHSYRQIIDEFTLGNIDILVGTQMVTKGLHFDNVSLVGVLNADSLLNFPDFRAFERAFQLLSQVSGRAGRNTRKGKVVIQTEKPDHPVLNWVKNNDYAGIYENLIVARRNFEYPPFFRIIQFSFKSKDQNELHDAASWFTAEVKKLDWAIVLGPEYPLVPRVNNEYIMKTVLKLKKDFSMKKSRESLMMIIQVFRSTKKFSKVRLVPDVDPQ